MMRDAAARFASGEVLPRVSAMDTAGEFEPDLIRGLFEAGFMGVEVDEKYGGCGSSFTSALLVVEELARADPAVSVMVDIHNTIVNNCFTAWASDRLKAQWLPRLVTDTLGAFALSEAGSGSDAFALKSTATRVGDEVMQLMLPSSHRRCWCRCPNGPLRPHEPFAAWWWLWAPRAERRADVIPISSRPVPWHPIAPHCIPLHPTPSHLITSHPKPSHVCTVHPEWREDVDL